MIKRVRGYLQATDIKAPDATHHLEKLGYVFMEGVFDADDVTTLKHEIAQVYDATPADERSGAPLESREMFRYGMLNRSAACQRAVAHRGLLDVLEPLLGEDCHVIANTAWRNPPASHGMHQGGHWHIDAGPHIPLADGVAWPTDIPHPVFAVGVHIYLKECTAQDGPTGVIPGSHLSGKFPPPDRLLDDDLEFNGQSVVPLFAKPGDVAMFVSDVWHRRMPTQPGDQGRLFLQVHYGRRDIAQRVLTTQQINQLSAEAIERAVTDRDKTVIGLHKPFFYDG